VVLPTGVISRAVVAAALKELTISHHNVGRSWRCRNFLPIADRGASAALQWTMHSRGKEKADFVTRGDTWARCGRFIRAAGR